MSSAGCRAVEQVDSPTLPEPAAIYLGVQSASL